MTKPLKTIMACTPQELVNANPCFGCLTEQQGDWTLTMLLCVVAGGAAPPPSGMILGDPNADMALGDPNTGVVFGIP